MSEISVVVVGSTSISSVVGNGDKVNITVGGDGSGGGAAATLQVGKVVTLDATQSASIVNVGTAYAAKLDFGIPRGFTGSTGPAGPVSSLKIGTVVTGADAAATITGTGTTQTLNLVLPQGATGERGLQGEVGPAGPANSLTVGSVSTGATAAVTITGNSPSQQISFVIPPGPTGPQGEPGPYTTVKVGTVTTGASGSSAKVDTVTSGSTVTLNFTIPRGVDGTANLADETPQPLGVSNPGTSGFAARADHVHAVPVIAYSNLTGVPTTFTPATHQHAISDVTNLQAVLDAKQASGSYATLDGSGKVPSSMLPSFVDDVVEYTNQAGFPATGEVGKIYVARDTNYIYRWSGSGYIQIASSPGSTDSVAEGTTNLYFTTKRAADAAPVQSVNGKTGNVTIEAGGIAWSSAPTSTTTVTKAGQISYDSSYLYVANDVDQWRRTPIEDWTTPTITISVQPSNQTAVGGTATFSVTATATQNAELLYQWQRQAGGTGGWTNIATGLSATLDLADLSYAANNGDKYRVVISSGAAGTGGTAVNGWLPAVVVELTPTATVTSDAATLTVSAAISIITQPQSVTLTNGTSAAFSLSATTPGTGLSYQWQSSPDGTNWTNISGATTASLSLTGITQTSYDGLRYRCIVSSSGYDDATSNAALLTVAPITVTTQPTSKTATPVAGTTPAYTTTFTVAGTSPAGPPSLQWQVSTDSGSTWSDVSGATSESLSLSALTWGDSGKRYRVSLTKTGWNTVTSNAATLTVPTDTIVVTKQPSNTTAAVSQFSSASFTLPDGTWSGISYVNNKWFATPSNSDFGGDYLGTSADGITWTKQSLALPAAANWRPIQYGGGVYLTFRNTASTKYITSTDGVTWTDRTFAANISAMAYIDGVGWLAQAGTLLYTSQDAVSWSSSSLGYSSITQIVKIGSSVLLLSGGTSPLRATISNGTLSSFTSIAGGNGTLLATSSSAALIQTNSTILTICDLSGGSPVNTSVTIPDTGFFVGACWDAPRSRWIAIATQTNTGTGGGIYTIAGNGSSIAKRLAIAVDYSFGGRVAIFSAGSRAVAYNPSGTAAGWYTSDDGGLNWALRTGPSDLAAKPYAVGGKIVAPTAIWTADDTSDTGSLVEPGGVVSATFSAAATTTFGTPDIQWQVSTDAGANWSDVSGATAPTLPLTPVSADTGKRYRARFTKDQYTTVNSNSATLTVP